MKIAHRAGHRPQQLSGGQQQRAAIARAVVAGPKLILADEPTGNLDSATGEEVMQLLTELNAEGTTIVMVTHSHPHAEYAHRIVNLLDGAIVTENIRRIACRAHPLPAGACRYVAVIQQRNLDVLLQPEIGQVASGNLGESRDDEQTE